MELIQSTHKNNKSRHYTLTTTILGHRRLTKAQHPRPMSASVRNCSCMDKTFYKKCCHPISEKAERHNGKPEAKCEDKQKRSQDDFCKPCKKLLKAQREDAREDAREKERGQASGRTDTSHKATLGFLLNDAPPPQSSSSSKAVTEKRRKRPVDSSTSSGASPRPSAKKSHVEASSSRSQAPRQRMSRSTTKTPARPLLVLGPLAPDPSSASGLSSEVLRSHEERQEDAEQRRQELIMREEKIARARERERQADLEEDRRRMVPSTHYSTQPAARYPGAAAAAPASAYYPAAPAPPSFYETVAPPSYRTIAPVLSPYGPQSPPTYRTIAPAPSSYDPQPPQHLRENRRPVVPPSQPAPTVQRSRRLEFTPGVLEPGARNLSGTPGQRARIRYVKEQNELKRQER